MYNIMEFVYLLMPNPTSWDDIIVITTEKEALQASIDNPTFRVEIFEKRENLVGYAPTRSYYKKGKWIKGK